MNWVIPRLAACEPRLSNVPVNVKTCLCSQREMLIGVDLSGCISRRMMSGKIQSMIVVGTARLGLKAVALAHPEPALAWWTFKPSRKPAKAKAEPKPRLRPRLYYEYIN